MKKTLPLILLLAILPAAAQAQWSANLNYGWLDNATPDWIESDHIGDEKPFSLWESGWQVGGGLEYRAKDWLAWGGCAAYQSFGAQPAGRVETSVAGQYRIWKGESSWQAPVVVHIKLIRPRAIMGTNLKLGLGVMASHIGKFYTEIDDNNPAELTASMPGTGETVFRPFGQVSAGIKLPITRRFGITLDYGFLMTFDRVVAEAPLVIGVAVGW